MDNINDLRNKLTDLSDRLVKVETWQEAQEKNMVRIDTSMEKLAESVKGILEKINKFDGMFRATIYICGIVSPIIFGMTQFILNHWMK